MVTFFKVVGWVMATISGLLVWNILPETRAVISCGMVVAFICYGISIVVGVTVKRLIGDELLELRLQCNAVANRLELMDRKGTVRLPGGDLIIQWRDSDDHVLMTGPVEYEGAFILDEALFEAAAS